MKNTRAPRETPLPPCLLLGSSRNSRMSQRSGGVFPVSLGSGVFYRNSTDIMGRCSDFSEGGDGNNGGSLKPLSYLVMGNSEESTYIPEDNNFEFDGPLTQLTLRFDKLCRACGATKLTSDFYKIVDYAKLGMTTYPSARCKPCHNARTAENQRVRRQAQKLLSRSEA